MANGNFMKIQSVSKQMARISLIFSTVTLTGVSILDDDVQVLDDVERDGFNFTDGCGMIGVKLVKKLSKDPLIQEKLSSIILDTGQPYLPSVWQIRYKGCKGVVAMNHTIDSSSMSIRKSMTKFECPSNSLTQRIGVAGFSRPYTFGHLNWQYITLLSGLGIEDEVFLSKQNDLFAKLDSMRTSQESAMELFQWQNKFKIAQEIAGRTTEEFLSDVHLQSEINQLRAQLIGQANRLRIMIPKSRNIYGVCDPFDVLNYGQCFLRLTINGRPTTLRGAVVVSKNPCYLLGDIRVLQAVDIADMQHADERQLLESMGKDLVDCIVFPTKGKQPHPDEIAGSDLDGDQFFVCWDEDLVTMNILDAYGYPADKSYSSGNSKVDRLEYFARQNRTSRLVGRIDSLFKKWADTDGIGSPKCKELGQLFAKAIDAAKTGAQINIPPRLIPKQDVQNLELKKPDANLFVWQTMAQCAANIQNKFASGTPPPESSAVTNNPSAVAISDDFIWGLLMKHDTNVSEFEKFTLASHIVQQKYPQADEEVIRTQMLLNFSKYIDFGRFSMDEQQTAIYKGIPRELVTNALNKSEILHGSMLQELRMSRASDAWRMYYCADHSGFDWPYLLKALTHFNHLLVVFKFPDEVIICLEFLQKCKPGENELQFPGSVSAILFSEHFNHKIRTILRPPCKIKLEEDGILQIHRGSVAQTFLWIGTKVDIKKYKRNDAVDNEQLLDRVSVDLTTFKSNILRGNNPHSLINKQPFLAIEVFIQNANMTSNYFDTHVGNEFVNVKQSEIGDDHDESIEDEESHEFIGEKQQYLLSTLHTIWVKQLSEFEFTESSVDSAINKILQGSNVMTVAAELSVVFQTKPQVAVELAKSLINMGLKQSGFDLLEIIISNCCTEENENGLSLALDIAAHWDMWCEIPNELGVRLANTLFTKWEYDSCDGQNNEANILELTSLIQSPSLGGMAEKLEENCIKYAAKYSSFILQNFIHEMATIKEDMSSSQDAMRRDHFCGFRVEHDSVKPFENLSGQASIQVTFYRSPSSFSRQLVPGIHVSVGVQWKVHKNPHWNTRCLMGQIRESTSTTQTIEISEPIPHFLWRCLQKKIEISWCFDTISNVTVYQRCLNALKLIAGGKSNSELLPILSHPAGHLDSEFIKMKPSEARMDIQALAELKQQLDPNLNDSQLMAIGAAASQQLTLILGPPGTGKTKVASHIISHVLYKQSENKILVVAETHIAVDNIARCLIEKGITIVRVGNRQSIADDVLPHSIDCQLEKIASAQGKQSHHKGSDEKLHRDTRLIKKIFKAAQVVCVTCAGAGEASFTSMKLQFTFVIIDEATLASEPSSLPAILSGAKQLTLIGDPKQLCPMFFDPSANTHGSSSAESENSLKATLFGRMQHLTAPYFLNWQHRMHPELAKFPSEMFYSGNLLSAVTAAEKPPMSFMWPDPNKPLCWMNIVNGFESRLGISHINRMEVDAVVKLVNYLLINTDCSPSQISILTPYTGQSKELKKNLGHIGGLEICTIDGFQGRENDMVIFSTVRANNFGNLGFISDPKRMNVLLTRARRGLIGVCNKDTLTNSQLWDQWFLQTPEFVEIERLALTKGSFTNHKVMVILLVVLIFCISTTTYNR